MRIVNQTQYDTRALRHLVTVAYRTLAKHEGAAHWWLGLRVRVQYGRRPWAVSGYAYPGGPIRLRLPRAGKPLQSWTVQTDGTKVQQQIPAPTPNTSPPPL